MTAIYTTEKTRELLQLWEQNTSLDDLAKQFEVPRRSIIAKLSSLGVYKRKEYVNKQGNPPRKKSCYIDSIAELLDKPAELLESLEKVNKNLLGLIETKLKRLKELEQV